jgi:nucleoside-diphosphate-sugar epimerase
MKNTITIAGGTGNLGARIIKALLQKGAVVNTLVRSTSNPEKINQLKSLGAKIVVVDFSNTEQLIAALKETSCVISALAGLRETIVDAQKQLVDACILAGVKRFIPSDFSIDFTNLRPGENRNLDLRRDFHYYLDSLPIASTTIFNGAFMDMLTEQIPMILFGKNKILYWGDADQSIDFTTMNNTAEFTANVALDLETPRYLHIAGDQITASEMAKVVEGITGNKFKLFRPGGLTLLNLIIKIAKFFNPAKQDLYPAWQGMQYMRDMMEGKTKQDHYDNKRYPEIKWTSVKELIATYFKNKK